MVDNALKDGVVYRMGEGEALVSDGPRFGKKLIIDYLYNRLSARQSDEVYMIPRKKSLKVGMTSEIWWTKYSVISSETFVNEIFL